MKLELGITVYHEGIYNANEPLKVVGIRENQVELEGDYSGGTHNVVQKDWFPIEGVRFIRRGDILNMEASDFERMANAFYKDKQDHKEIGAATGGFMAGCRAIVDLMKEYGYRKQAESQVL